MNDRKGGISQDRGCEKVRGREQTAIPSGAVCIKPNAARGTRAN